MKFKRWWWWWVCLFAVCLCEDVQERNVPRSLRIFSKGPDAEDERYEGRNVLNHIDNALNGGTIGVQVDMKKHKLGKLAELWGKVKKFFSSLQRFKASSQPEGRELEGDFFPVGLDPRSKWRPSRLVASDGITVPDSRPKEPDNNLDSRDPDILLFDPRPKNRYNEIPGSRSEDRSEEWSLLGAPVDE